MAVCRQLAVDKVVGGQALVSGNPDAFENRERELCKPTHADRVGSQAGGADRFLYTNVRELNHPVILALTGEHGPCLGHRVVRVIYSTISIRMVGSGADYLDPEQLVKNVRELRA